MSAEALLGPLERLDRILARGVERVVASHGDELPADPFRGLYISEGDAARWSQSPRWTPILGAACEEPPLVDSIAPDSALAAVGRTYGLSSFDLELLMIALAPEVDLRYGRIYAFLQDDVSRRWPAVDLALNLLCPTAEAKLARREHFAADAPLLRDDLIELVPEAGEAREPLLAHRMKLDDTVVRRLLGVGGLDPRLRQLGAQLDAGDPPAHAADPGLARLVTEAHRRGEPLRLYFSGRPTALKRGTALALAREAGAALLTVDPSHGGGLDDLLGVVLREAALHGAVLHIEPVDLPANGEPPAGLHRLLDGLARHRGVAILGGSRPDPPRGHGLRGMVHVRFELPDHAQRLDHWSTELGGAGIALRSEDVELLAATFRLTADEIADAAAVAHNRARMEARDSSPEDVFTAARTRAHAGTSTLAQRIEPTRERGELVLPGDTAAQLEEMRHQIVKRHRVLDEWGFGRRHPRGRGVSALFAGPSGTGKTTAAENLAGALRLDLLKIDLSGVVSKYIGETEKNLRRIFSDAENANAIVFFDEADALFGKRSEVRDSHDRYANIEIAYLLEQMERYEGVAILATNLRQNMDDAFVRRLRFVVEFPVPTEEERVRIWELQFPDEAERDAGIDFGLLARQFRVTGGSIKNIVLGAAFLAASDGRAIGMQDLLRATRREYQKLGRVLSDAEFGPLVELVAA